jgi:hypothetical protein
MKLIAVLFLFAFGVSASAESMASLVQNFGLLGTWSEDCADAKRFRIIYSNGLVSGLQLRVFGRNPDGSNGSSEFEILEVTPVTVEKLLLRVRQISLNEVKLSPQPAEQKHIFEKIGSKMKMMGEIILERCLN